MARPSHPNKEIEAVVTAAEDDGWTWHQIKGNYILDSLMRLFYLRLRQGGVLLCTVCVYYFGVINYNYGLGPTITRTTPSGSALSIPPPPWPNSLVIAHMRTDWTDPSAFVFATTLTFQG
jgi:hypothetical protein